MSVWVTACAVVFGVSACSGGGTSVANTSAVAVRSPSVSPSAPAASPSATVPVVPTTGPNVLPGATPPVLPAVAKQETYIGAGAFVASYVQAVDWAYSTTDSTVLKAYLGVHCVGCSEAVGVFDQTKAAGLHFVGGHLTVKGSSRTATPGQDVASQSLELTITAGKLQDLDSNNHVVATYPPMVVTAQYSVQWSTGAWHLVRVAYVPVPANG
jgi:hypothetical protein